MATSIPIADIATEDEEMFRIIGSDEFYEIDRLCDRDIHDHISAIYAIGDNGHPVMFYAHVSGPNDGIMTASILYHANIPYNVMGNGAYILAWIKGHYLGSVSLSHIEWFEIHPPGNSLSGNWDSLRIIVDSAGLPQSRYREWPSDPALSEIRVLAEAIYKMPVEFSVALSHQ